MFHASYGPLKTNLPISRQVSSGSQGQEGEIEFVQHYCGAYGQDIMKLTNCGLSKVLDRLPIVPLGALWCPSPMWRFARRHATPAALEHHLSNLS
ncbi:hypothetical protein KC333_g59 [Hortaea werneckii]|nr:hypothetical protein KC333_g59 [Hortaea werneckii]